MDFSLKEKTAIVVGGSKGLGFGMATGLAQAGANVVLVSRNQGQLDDAAAKISQETGNENVVGFATDITSVENINGLRQVRTGRYSVQWGRCQQAVFCSGIHRSRLGRRTGYTAEIRVFHVSGGSKTNGGKGH